MIEFTPAALGGISVFCVAAIAFIWARSQLLDQPSDLKKERRLQPRTAEQAFTPKQQAERKRLSFKEQLENSTGCTITNILHGKDRGLRWVRIDFTWKWNGYVTKSASAKAACDAVSPSRELKAKAHANMTKEMGLNNLDWNY